MGRGLLLSLLVAVVALPAGRVAAHASLAASTPADGAVVTEPLREVTLTFSESVEPTADGFAITADGGAVETAVTTTDGSIWVLSFEPITAGTVAVAYDVVSADGHLVTGELSFTVDAPAAATTVPPPVASAPPAAATTLASAPPTSVAPAPVDAGNGDSGTVMWVIVIAAGVALLGVLGWSAARRPRP